jgi:hypothetical protein
VTRIIFWDVTTFSLIEVYKHMIETSFVHSVMSVNFYQTMYTLQHSYQYTLVHYSSWATLWNHDFIEY